MSKTLLLSPRVTNESIRMRAAAESAGWRTHQMPAWGEFPPDPADAYYGESLYGRLMLQEGHLRGTLIDHPDSWLTRLPPTMLGRMVRLCTLGEVVRQWGPYPLFCKPADEKTFVAGVFSSPADLPTYLDRGEKVLAATPVTWGDEFRVFLLNGLAQTVSRYSRYGSLDVGWDKQCLRAGDVAEEAFAAAPGLPAGVVIDVGLIAGMWVVVEANQAWCSALYACAEKAVLPVVEESCRLPS